MAALCLLVVFTAGNLLYVLAALVCGLLAISTLWVAATDQRLRWWAAAAAVIFVAGAIASLVAAGADAVAIVVVVIGIAGSVWVGKLGAALGSPPDRDVALAAGPGDRKRVSFLSTQNRVTERPCGSASLTKPVVSVFAR